MNRVVIDTNVLISWYQSGMVASHADLTSVIPAFSVITKIEALGFPRITKSEIRAINNMLNTGELIYIDQNIVEKTIALRQQLRIKTPDAIIAATALVNSMELWTANISDFSGIRGLKLRNPTK